MSRILDIAFWNYDRTRMLQDGTVKIEGVEARFHSARIVPQIFEAMIRRRAFDVSEMGMTYYLRTFDDAGHSPFVALPVFLNRAFRHSAIYVNRAANIRAPRDLIGKRIGELALYGHDAGVMPKGILSDEYGVRPEQSRWIVGGIDFPMEPIDFVPRPVPDGVDVEWAGKDVDLGRLLETGEIDALFSADVPHAVLAGSPQVGRLFEDYEVVERDYYRRTGIFPIMHAVVVPRELAEREPDLIRAVYRGFVAAKDGMEQRYVEAMTFNNMGEMHPWLTKLIGENRALLGDGLVALRHRPQPRRDGGDPALPSRTGADCSTDDDRGDVPDRTGWLMQPGSVVAIDRRQHGEQRTADATVFAEQPRLDGNDEWHRLAQRRQTGDGHRNVLGGAVRVGRATLDHRLPLQRTENLRHLHRVNVAGARELGLHHGLVGTSRPGGQRQRNELQMGKIERPQRLIDLALVAMDDAPHHETDRVLRGTKRHRFEHGGDVGPARLHRHGLTPVFRLLRSRAESRHSGVSDEEKR